MLPVWLSVMRRRVSKPRSRRLRRVFIVLLLVCAVAFVLLHYNQDVELTAYDVGVPGLPPELDGLRVVQLSDIHRSIMVPDSLIEQAVGKANSTHADIALLTGDLVSRGRHNAEPCAKMLSKLDTRLGIYAVLGNHDQWTNAKAVTTALSSRGIEVLRNKHCEPAKGLYLVGTDFVGVSGLKPGHPYVRKAFKRVPEDVCYLMVSHTPRAVICFKGKRGLLITGHTHGGQVQIPHIRRNRLPGLMGWKYIQGWYREGDILMYVNRGVGMVNPAVRFRCPPEVTLYVLHPEGGPKATWSRRSR